MKATFNFELSTQGLSIGIRKCWSCLCFGWTWPEKENCSNFYQNPNNVGQEHVTSCPVDGNSMGWKVCKGWHLSSFLQYSLSLIGHKAKNNNKIYLTLYFIVMIEQVITFFGMLRHNNGTLARHGSQDGSHGWTDHAFNVQTWTQPSAASPPDQN